ncbi:MAG: DUF2628 domain-containing protein [Alphaproteobacteria bacterium]
MRLYTVHLRRVADPLFTPDLGAVFVREGFNWAAFIFTWIWALACGLWIPAAILFAGDLIVAFAADGIGLDSNSQFFVALGWHLVVGFVAEDLRRWQLRMRGYALAEIVAGENLSAAERRFFDHHPAMAKPAWR